MQGRIQDVSTVFSDASRTNLPCFFADLQSFRLSSLRIETYLNLIERLWRQMRANITKDHFFSTLKETCQAVINWLEDFSFQKFMSLLGIDVEEFPQIEYIV